MKKITLLTATLIFCLVAMAQKKDTIRIGGMVIVKEGKKGHRSIHMDNDRNYEKRKRSNISTNWGIVDLGFANYDDKTDYSTTGSYLVNRPGYPNIGKSDLKLRTGKSVNVNIWFFMQRLNLVKHKVNLKYGLGLELNNYRYKSSSMLSYKEGGVVPYTLGTVNTNEPFIFRDSIQFSKNKLALDYLTVPVMLNFATHANQRKGISMSVGVSAGYLYSSRNKQVSDERGKLKNKGEYDIERFKFSYVAELGIAGIRFYGSYSPKSMYEHSLNIRPYNIGLRFSNW